MSRGGQSSPESDSAPWFDLQAHSTHSDGALEPAAVVARARESGVQLLALSDHDTVAGVEEARRAAAGTSIAVVAAVEISALHDGQEDLHILGYGLDHSDPGLLQALSRFQADREGRAERMAVALGELGLAVDEEILAAQRRSGSIGRPHLAQAVFRHPDNADRLAAEGLTAPEQVLVAYLLPGKPGYRQRTTPTVREAIDLIHDAGGVAVWAHPFWDIDSREQVLKTLQCFAGWGMDGVEAFYVTYNESQTRSLANAAESLGLLTTGSADFHGPDHKLFSRFRAFSLYGCEPRLGSIDQRS